MPPKRRREQGGDGAGAPPERGNAGAGAAVPIAADGTETGYISPKLGTARKIADISGGGGRQRSATRPARSGAPTIKVMPLGAGQDVGRSCIVLNIAGRTIMLDCGMHMGYSDARCFPDFRYLSRTGDFDAAVTCVIVSHFHLDHCGALPLFTELCGYNGPVYMTYPTKAICPILLEDYRKIMVERRGEEGFFTNADISACMRKVIPMQLHSPIKVDDELEITPFYAGHVLGAAMFHIRVGTQSVVYTGDFNLSPDRHLGAAWIERLMPDVLITESTYATSTRESKRGRETEFLSAVDACVRRGGKVLIPVFAVGRAQELCILLDSYCRRVGLDVPMYFSSGLVQRANEYYKLFETWTSMAGRAATGSSGGAKQDSVFHVDRIQLFRKEMATEPGPIVLFATPGMLHAGTSLEIFKLWAGDERNAVLLPGYCVAGTVGHRLQGGENPVALSPTQSVDVRCAVQSLSFSAHADAKGIMQLVRHVAPKQVVLVHGDRGGMVILKDKIRSEVGVPCYDPSNGTALELDAGGDIPLFVSEAAIAAAAAKHADRLHRSSTTLSLTHGLSVSPAIHSTAGCDGHEPQARIVGFLAADGTETLLLSKREAAKHARVAIPPTVTFSDADDVPRVAMPSSSSFAASESAAFGDHGLGEADAALPDHVMRVRDVVVSGLSADGAHPAPMTTHKCDDSELWCVTVGGSVHVYVAPDGGVSVAWSTTGDALGVSVRGILAE